MESKYCKAFISLKDHMKTFFLPHTSDWVIKSINIVSIISE